MDKENEKNRIENCQSCELVARKNPKDLIAYESQNFIVNHSLDTGNHHSGWFIIFPKRHLCRFFELTQEEQNELNTIIAATDKALTEAFGSKRTMIASLGWHTYDHLHIHMVPTISEPVTYGYENFGENIYQPLGETPQKATRKIKKILEKLLSN